jgi:N-sulfoglucosamine sulfohydrolase
MPRCILFLLAVAGLALTADAAHAKPKNIILFVTDDMGQDAGCFGNKAIRTPNIDKLAAEGTLFKNAYATTASCSASRSVILTGMHNHANGHYGHEHAYHHFRAFDRVRSLPFHFTEAGYRTARIGKFHVGPDTVFKFEHVLAGNARNPVQMANNCKELLKGDKPFFLYFCTADPHRGGGLVKDDPLGPNAFGNTPKGYPGVTPVKYNPKDVIVPPFLPDTPTCRAELAQYYEAVSRVDQGLGRLVELLKETGNYDSTLIVFLSDNGIPFPGAKTTAYEPGLRLPCIVRHPDAKKRGVVSSAMVSWVDLAPTLLDFAGAMPKNPTFHGRSFLPILEEANPKGWDEIYASHQFHEVTMYYPMRTVRSGKYKLIWNIAHPLPFPFASDLWEAATWQDVYKKGREALYGKRTVQAYMHRPAFELYDLEADPHEVKNLAGDPQHAKLLEELKDKLKAFQKRTSDPWISKWEYE